MEWKPIETAPKDGTEIIVMRIHIDTQIVNNAFWMDDDEFGNVSGWWSYTMSEVSRTLLNDWLEPTHWMPLPNPPESEK